MRELLLAGITACLAVLLAGDIKAAKPAAKIRKAYGIEKRVPWTSSRIHGTPDPPSPYATEVAFPELKFYEPLAMTVMPGTNRLVVAERPGKIYSFLNDPQTRRKDLLVDVGHTVYGVALHPQFLRNGWVYVTYILPDGPPQTGSRLSRFQVTDMKSLRADPATEQVVLQWPTGGHNGGCIRFGPDGYLYLATGDGSGIADQLQTGQDLGDLLGAILRLDVDHPQQDRAYGIPPDNPFVDRPGARGEIYSYGHRQVWKFSFDEPTDRLWAGDVGQDLWEMIYLIQKGGNYGWSIREGRHPFRPERKQGPTPFVDPIVEHPHSEFRSITGGYVYRATRLPNLREAYIYGDYDTGKIWCLRYDGKKVVQQHELSDTQLRIVAFGQDRAGEVYVVDFIAGRIHRLIAAAGGVAQDFPRKLSQTGLFRSTQDHQVAAGLIPYSVNAPLWSDGAVKQRYIALPGHSQIEFDSVVYPQPAPGAQAGWRFPHDAVLVKTFSMEMEVGNPNSLRRLETRILHHKRMPGTDEVGAQFWRGYTYVWNEEQSDADLLHTDGLDRTLTIKDRRAPGGQRKLTWRFPSRAECTLCHTMASKYVLGVNTLQMNKDHDYDGVIANQLATLNHLRIFHPPLPHSVDRLPRIVGYRDRQQPLQLRARSYLHANCAHCHRKWGGGNAEFQLLAALPLSETGILEKRPGQGTFRLNDPRILVPGASERSLILYRMKKLGLGRMPHIASNQVDDDAVQMIAEWIEQLSTDDYQQTGIVD